MKRILQTPIFSVAALLIGAASPAFGQELFLSIDGQSSATFNPGDSFDVLVEFNPGASSDIVALSFDFAGDASDVFTITNQDYTNSTLNSLLPNAGDLPLSLSTVDGLLFDSGSDFGGAIDFGLNSFITNERGIIGLFEITISSSAVLDSYQFTTSGNESFDSSFNTINYTSTELEVVLSSAVVPEPSTWAMLAVTGVAFGWYRRYRKSIS